jgi:hypothetical protein
MTGRASRPLWQRLGSVHDILTITPLPEIVVVAGAIGLVVVGLPGVDTGRQPCTAEQPCLPEPIAFTGLGLLLATVVAVFVHRSAARWLALTFGAMFLMVGLQDLALVWWVQAYVAGFVVVCWVVLWPQHGWPATVSFMEYDEVVVPSRPERLPWLRPGRALVGGVLLLVALAAAVAVTSSVRQTAGEAFAVTGLAGGLAFAVGWRPIAANLDRRRLFRREQPLRRVQAVLVGGKVIVLPPSAAELLIPTAGTIFHEKALVIPALTGRLDAISKALAGDRVQAVRTVWLYGEAAERAWCAVRLDAETVVPTGPATVAPVSRVLTEMISIVDHMSRYAEHARPDVFGANRAGRAAAQFAHLDSQLRELINGYRQELADTPPSLIHRLPEAERPE